MKKIQNISKQFELKKHVSTIHCSNNIGLVQRKLFNVLLFNAYPDLPHKQTFNIPVRRLCELIGYNSNDYNTLKQALIGLMTITLEWNVIDCATGQEKKWQASTILASAEMSDGMCTYEYSQIMKEFLYKPEIYGRIDINLISHFKSSYGLALYENCVRYQGLLYTPWFITEKFRILMGVCDDKYTIFKDFKKRVLDPAVKEVNAISNIHITAEIERKNQKVTKIRFKLAQSIDACQKIEQDHNHPVSESLMITLRETFILSPKTIDSLFLNYEAKYIQEKVKMILVSDKFLAGQIRGLAGYLIDALKNNYQLSQSSKTVIEKRYEQKKQQEKDIAEEERLQQDKYRQYVAQKMNDYINSLSSMDRDQLFESFDTHIRSTQTKTIVNWYEKYKFDHPAIKNILKIFIEKQSHDSFPEIMSYESFKMGHLQGDE